MNKTLIGIAAAVALIGTPALAADLPLKAPEPVVAAPVYNWSGCYVGLNAGGGWQVSSFTTEGSGSGAGVLGGAQVGCNAQWRQFVIGAEGEFWGSTLSDREFNSEPGDTFQRTSHNRWDGAVSVRSGIAFDRTLVYGKLGVVWGKFDYASSEIDPSDFFASSASAIFTGVLLGVGFEYALTEHWTTKLEYNYIDYGNTIVNFTGVACDPGCVSSPQSVALKETKQLIKLGVNYKF